MPALDRLLLRLRLAWARRDAWFVAEHQAKPAPAADVIELGFPAADAAWNGIGPARDGTIYWCAA